ncbi:acyl-CoA dehydrogenase family protein [Patulibacter sp. NPDC049589]|uniref:acyl-CoA dehydrogenase family protein n=1 Tax=Patulibacter sp. NPDC049589 TaxID=3154731 RepID=UPI003446BC91
MPGAADTTTIAGDVRVRTPDLSDAGLRRVTDALAALADGNDRAEAFPDASIGIVHEAGLLTYGVSPELGGALEPTITDTARIMRAVGQGDPSVALLTAMTVAQHLVHAASDVFPAELYAGIVAESQHRPVLLNAIRAEPELGAPARGGLPKTKVRRTENGWVVSGHKAYGTGSEGLAYHLVWAATEDDEPLQGHVIVPGDHPGIEVIRTWDHLGMRATSTHDVVYHDIEVPLEHFKGEPLVPGSLVGGGSRRQGNLAAVGLAVTAIYVGVARAAQEFFTRFAHERVPGALGRPIAQTERIQSIAGEIDAQLFQAEELLLGVARRADEGDPAAAAQAPFVKLLATRSAVTAVQTAVQALGNPALSRHHPLERHLRDVLCCRIHPPQDDMALIFLGKRSLGL